MFVGDRERDRSGADPDVEDARFDEVAEKGETALDHDLGLGAGNERPVVDLEEKAAEAPLTEDVGERLAPDPAPNEFFQSPTLVGRHRAVRRVELGAGDSEHVGDQDLGVDARRRHTGCAELELDLVDGVQGHLDSFAADSHAFLTPRRLQAPAAAPLRRAPR